MTTMDEFVTAARAAGMDAQLIPPRGTGPVPPVANIWTAANTRIPAATVWLMAEGEYFTWGHHGENVAPASTDAAALVTLVAESLNADQE